MEQKIMRVNPIRIDNGANEPWLTRVNIEPFFVILRNTLWQIQIEMELYCKQIKWKNGNYGNT